MAGQNICRLFTIQENQVAGGVYMLLQQRHRILVIMKIVSYI